MYSERSIVTQHWSTMNIFQRLACTRPIISELLKKIANDNESNLSNLVIQFVGVFVFILSSLPSLHLHSIVQLDIKRDNRMHFPFCRMLRLPRRPTAKRYKTQATWHHDHRPFVHRNRCCVHCKMLVLACTCQNRRNRPHTAPPSQRSEAIKVYSTFFRDDFIWTLSRCTIRVSLFCLAAVFVFFFL